MVVREFFTALPIAQAVDGAVTGTVPNDGSSAIFRIKGGEGHLSGAQMADIRRSSIEVTRRLALQLHALEWGYERIGAALGVDWSQVRRWVKAHAAITFKRDGDAAS